MRPAVAAIRLRVVTNGAGGPRRGNVVGTVSGRLAGAAERLGGRAALGRDLHGVPPALQGWLDLMLRTSDLRHVHLRVQAQGLSAVRMGGRAPGRSCIKLIRGGKGGSPVPLGHGGPDRLATSCRFAALRTARPRRPASWSWGHSPVPRFPRVAAAPRIPGRTRGGHTGWPMMGGGG